MHSEDFVQFELRRGPAARAHEQCGAAEDDRHFGSEVWGDVGGQALKEGAVAALKQVDELSQAELGTHLFRLGEDDAIHGVFSELPWELELQAELVRPRTHFGREWEPVLSATNKQPVPFTFVHGVKQ
ncbi:unnamed protein product [Phytophthora lilii]|uniref:Unnamed protein product n=1 Tax=Phytophthora lilii TaxID=2077276 RepID=A0A9W7CJ96_9STRA|nr:unnamed protein product [Phytophthora lilii]